jgi:hypothetical protein
MKGLIFAGCSFTWGQGLYYYSGMETIKYPAPDAYDSKLVSDAHKRHMATLRYPRLVADHFNTWEVVSKQNGGSEETSIHYLNAAFGLIKEYGHLIEDKFDYSEIEYVVIQTSQPNRNGFYYKYKGKDCKFLIFDQDSKLDFYEWIIEERKITIEQWREEHTIEYLNKLKNMMMFLENKGIKTKILCWENDYINPIKDDIFMYNRYIDLEYRGVKFSCIRDLMSEHPHLTINSDYDHFENPPKDHHPSKECHEIMAKAVIASIEKDLKDEKDSNHDILIQDYTKEKESPQNSEDSSKKIKSLI